jgi:hypothetical protein
MQLGTLLADFLAGQTYLPDDTTVLEGKSVLKGKYIYSIFSILFYYQYASIWVLGEAL